MEYQVRNGELFDEQQRAADNLVLAKKRLEEVSTELEIQVQLEDTVSQIKLHTLLRRHKLSSQDVRDANRALVECSPLEYVTHITRESGMFIRLHDRIKHKAILLIKHTNPSTSVSRNTAEPSSRLTELATTGCRKATVLPFVTTSPAAKTLPVSNVERVGVAEPATFSVEAQLRPTKASGSVDDPTNHLAVAPLTNSLVSKFCDNIAVAPLEALPMAEVVSETA